MDSIVRDYCCHNSSEWIWISSYANTLDLNGFGFSILGAQFSSGGFSSFGLQQGKKPTAPFVSQYTGPCTESAIPERHLLRWMRVREGAIIDHLKESLFPWACFVVLHLLVIIINASFQRGSGGHAVVGGSLLDVFFGGSVQLFLEDGVGVKGFELGLEVT